MPTAPRTRAALPQPAARKAGDGPSTRPRIYGVPFAEIYPLYVQKAERKGRTKEEVDEIIFWLTGHTARSLRKVLQGDTQLETFYAEAPRFQPKARSITGVVCGVRLEEIKDEVMWQIRCLDKLIDELAKGKPMERILRS